MITKEKIEQFNKLETEKAELATETKRIDAFLGREPGNQDNARAIDAGHIFVKFAGTACKLPVGLFEAELRKRKKACEDRLMEIETEFNNL